mmetsp:Transcript_4405/g.9768  ORF Transcript_4405/g.9768 Transcript_4405/m.9768 type:complete len:363 (+) Transcript_4405:231-1319(+)|eukprot:CAMPEP_0183735110 /NCGR_PEP_ID=MMETSP0737-20130205/45716_1 /TAXON_ID=385413 /ORGANISM="Thalassiosira miniscula, Strain CCMP1093" /LENGTH=362 /DNA_ID=CAMNT_0025968767 /DNA_START=89 /DNA_END=1177 /DNA_ORIENTATION=+
MNKANNLYEHGLQSRPSFSSHSSQSSGEGGGKIKPSLRRRNVLSSLDLHHHRVGKDTQARSGSRATLEYCSNRTSLPSILDRRSLVASRDHSFSKISTTKNEEWDSSKLARYKIVFPSPPKLDATPISHTKREKPVGRRRSDIGLNSSCPSCKLLVSNKTDIRTRASNVRNSSKVKEFNELTNTARHSTRETSDQGPSKHQSSTTHSIHKKRHVAFAKTQGIINTSNTNTKRVWFTTSENDQFLANALNHANKINHVMKYVASSETSYNPSTGLTSPRVLKEYLSSPEEIIGIEHLLSGQKIARENLKSHHKKALFEEQQDRDDEKEEGENLWQILAESLRSTSTISEHMAQQRAKYITLLE